MSEPVRVGVIGLGFMGQTHCRSVRRLEDMGLARLSCVCDGREDRLSGRVAGSGNISAGDDSQPLFDPSVVRTFRDASALIDSGEADLVSICTPSDTHVDLAIRALQGGCHVLVEKPVATIGAEIARLAEVAGASDRLCMPAMCIRFWPAWRWLHDRIADGTLGPLQSLSLIRLGSMPDWSPGFYDNPERSGGALFDLHIHDTDFLYWCLGMPDRVDSSGDLMQLATLYHYDQVPGPILAVGGWKQQPAFGFRMRYTACFGEATADFDLARDDQLLLHRGDTTQIIALSPFSGWDLEMEHLVRAIREGSQPEATLEDALRVGEILESERRSLSEDRSVELGCV